MLMQHISMEIQELITKIFKTIQTLERNTIVLSSTNEHFLSQDCSFYMKVYEKDNFDKIRKLYNIDSTTIKDAFVNKYILGDLYPGNSGSILFYSHNFKFVIKTIRKEEKITFLSYINDYIKHLVTFPDSLLIKIFGIYKIDVIKKRKYYFIVMNNLFPQNKNISFVYDLKGEIKERKAAPDNFVKKDVDYYVCNTPFYLGNKDVILFQQIKKDIYFLKQRNIMDYSLMIVICNANHQNKIKFKEINNFTKNINESVGENSTIVAENNEINFENNLSCIVAVKSNEVYYFGIIDIMTKYNTKKFMESIINCLNCYKSKSFVNPGKYSERLLDIIDNQIVFKKEKSE